MMSKEIDLNSLRALDLVGGADTLEHICRRMIIYVCNSEDTVINERLDLHCEYQEIGRQMLLIPPVGKDSWWKRVQEMCPIMGWTLDDMLPQWSFPSPEIEAAWRRKWDLVEKNGPYSSFMGYMKLQFLFEKSEWEHYGRPTRKIDFNAIKVLVT